MIKKVDKSVTDCNEVVVDGIDPSSYSLQPRMTEHGKIVGNSVV